ncbi:MAG: hypothetical protein ACFFFH_15255 [Candidatus Thorarchaeota archaeon]
MRILHVGDRLPDVRIERFILLDHQLGHTCGFIGETDDPLITALDLKMPLPIYNLKIDRSFRLGSYSQENLENLNSTLIDFNPDILHIHNLYFLSFIRQFFKKRTLSFSFVYNDHEYWSETNYLRYKGFKSSLKLHKALSSYYKAYLYKKWEKRFIPGQVVITVSEEIMKIHDIKFSAKFATFIPNMPILDEVNQAIFSKKADEKTAVYIGKDFTNKHVPTRYTGDILEMWKEIKPAKLIVIGDNRLQSDDCIYSTGIVPHMKLYDYSSRAHFGLLAYNPHYFHKYISPNKIYIYIHAGALPILPRNVPFEVDVPRFSNQTELFEILEHHHLPDLNEIRNLARDTLVADNFIDRLKQAYEEALTI